jgi:hypothetical protein
MIAVASSVTLLRGYSTGIQILVRGVMLLIVVVLVHRATSQRSL